MITRAVQQLTKWQAQLSAAEETITAAGALEKSPLTPRVLRKIGDDMLALRRDLMASDARETRDDPSVRRRRGRST